MTSIKNFLLGFLLESNPVVTPENYSAVNDIVPTHDKCRHAKLAYRRWYMEVVKHLHSEYCEEVIEYE